MFCECDSGYQMTDCQRNGYPSGIVPVGRGYSPSSGIKGPGPSVYCSCATPGPLVCQMMSPEAIMQGKKLFFSFLANQLTKFIKRKIAGQPSHLRRTVFLHLWLAQDDPPICPIILPVSTSLSTDLRTTITAIITEIMSPHMARMEFRHVKYQQYHKVARLGEITKLTETSSCCLLSRQATKLRTQQHKVIITLR